MSSKKEKSGLLSTVGERLVNGLFKENPTFVLLLGMCPTLAVTTSAMNGLGMGATTLVVLALSNMMISALRKVIPDKIRIPAFIVIIASFVTIVELLLNAYIPSLYDALGLYIPLIVVNCIILGRAEAYAYSNPVIPSFFDGIGMGLGFTVALTIIGAVRELLGAGEIFGARVMPQGYIPVSIFVMAPGAFFVLAVLTAIQNAIKIAGTKRGKDMSKIQSCCGGNCLECNKECKVEMKSEVAETETTEDDSLETSESETAEVDDKSESEALSEAVNTVAEESTEEVNSENQTEAVSTVVEPESEESETEEVSETEETSGNEAQSESEVSLDESESETEVASESESEEISSESETISESEAVSETETVSESEAQPESETKDNDTIPASSDDDDGELVLLDLSDYKRAMHKSSNKNKPARKKTSRAKALAMLSKADENMKEDKND